MIENILLKIISLFRCRLKNQLFFESLCNVALKGMNCGSVTDPVKNGENRLLYTIKSKLSDKELNIFDVGANVGNNSILFANYFGVFAKIYSFEPSLKTFISLKDNTKVYDNIVVENFGFSDREERVTLYMDKDHSGLASVYRRKLDHYNIFMNKSEDVVLKTIDNYCLLNSIDVIHFLKIDVEGHEIKVLEGARDMINSNSIYYIQFEFGGTSIDAKSYFRDFFYSLNDKYNIYRVVPDGVFQIKEYTESKEIFLYSNYFAALKELSK